MWFKMFAVQCLVLSQSTPVRDKQTDRRRDGQNYDSEDCASMAASRGKMSNTSVIDLLSQFASYTQENKQ